MFAGVVTVAALHPNQLTQSHLWLPSLVVSICAGFVLVFPNCSGIRFLTAVKWLGFGAVSTLVAFALQSLLNGSLVRFLGAGLITNSVPALLLGAGAALCQTLGKFGAIRLGMCDPAAKADSSLSLSIGLGVGLGFGICETVLLGIQEVLRGVPVNSMIGALERASASGFHIYSAGLVAAGIALRSMGPIFLVLTIHAITDGFSVALGHRVTLCISESVILVLAIATWGFWIAAAKRVRSRAGTAS